MANFCLIKRKVEHVNVRLEVDNGGQSGIQLWLYRHNGIKYEVIEELEGHSGTTGEISLTINTNPNDMEGTILTWLITTCNRISGDLDVNIKVDFYQDGEKCSSTEDSRYKKQYPHCQTAKALENRGQVAFTVINDIKIERLWVNM